MSNLQDIKKHQAELKQQRKKLLDLAANISASENELIQQNAKNATGDTAVALNQHIAQLKQQAQQTQNVIQATEASLNSSRLQILDLEKVPPEQRVAQLNGNVPVALLPIRIETRYLPVDNDPESLWIRIYPDELHITGHEAELTEDEILLAIRYWQEWLATEEQNIRDAAWRRLAEDLGAERADWVVLRTRELVVDKQAPDFATIQAHTGIKPDDWSEPATAQGLPDAFLAIGYKDGKTLFRQWGKLLPNELFASPRPDLNTVEENESLAAEKAEQNELDMGPELDWVIDLHTAEQAGMAIQVPVTPQIADGIDRIVVLGVNFDSDSKSGAETLQDMLTAHRFEEGFEFLTPGVATNNTEHARSGLGKAPQTDLVQREATKLNSRSVGKAFTSSLGLSEQNFTHVNGCDRQDASQHMLGALWPATLGYYIQQMLHGVVDPNSVEQIKQHTIQHLRARGALPAIRIGQQPYGILPITPLDQVTLNENEAPLSSLRELLQKLRGFWREAARKAPKIGNSEDPADDLFAIFEQTANSQNFNIRPVIGCHTDDNAKLAYNKSLIPAAERNFQYSVARLLLMLFGVPQDEVRIMRAYNQELANKLRLPLVDSNPLSEKNPLQYNYISALKRRLQPNNKAPYYRAKQSTFFAQLLEKSIELSLAQSALKIGYQLNIFEFDQMVEAELIDIEVEADSKQDKGTLTWERVLKKKVPAGQQHAGKPLYDLIDLPEYQAYNPHIHSLLADMTTLHNLPTAELDRLIRETLDAFTYRYDAWVTSFANKRLAQQRQKQADGLYLGAYGFVENLRPAARSSRSNSASSINGKANKAVYKDPQNAGYVLAPSLSHAATSAVLRAGFLSNGGAEKRQLSIDLSSKRAGLALELIDGIRQGRSLAELLGYRLERYLNEHEQFAMIRAIRALAPLEINLAGNPDEDDIAISGRVVDGLKVVQAYINPESGVRALLDDIQTEAITTLKNGIEEIADTFDALADLGMAESVYQIAEGNPERSAAMLQAIDKGDIPPPEPQITRTPRSGIGLTQRLAIMLPNEPIATWGIPNSPRHQADPRFDAWLASMLGDPSTYSFIVRLSGKNNDDEKSIEIPLEQFLRQQGLSAMDVVYGLTPASAGAAHGSEFAQLLVLEALQKHPNNNDLWNKAEIISQGIDKSYSAKQNDSFAKLSFLSAELRNMLHKTRPLTGVDLSPPDTPQAGGVNLHELRARCQQIHTMLENLIQLVKNSKSDSNQLRTALAKTLPFNPVDADLAFATEAELQKTFTSTLANLKAQKQILHDATQAKESPQLELDALLNGLKQTFHNNVLVAPLILSDASNELAQQTQHSAIPAKGSGTLQDSLLRASLTRDSTDRLQRVITAQNAVAPTQNPATDLIALQLPLDDKDSWVGGELTKQQVPTATVGILALAPGQIDYQKGLSGLMLDEWMEAIPRASETAGLAFNHNAANTEAANAILLATHPYDDANWSVEMLETIVNEALDLAKIRAARPDQASWLGRLGPPVYLPSLESAYSAGFAFPGLTGLSLDK